MNDALYSDKWSPDTYLVTKSYVTDDAPTNTRYAAIKYCPEQYNAFQKLTKENGINDLKKFSADKTLLLLDLYHGCILEIRCVQEGKDLSVAKFVRMNYYSLFSDWYF